MALQLFEGQDFGAHYSLLHRIAEGERGENWLALDRELNERVLIKVFNEPLGESDRARISANLSSLKGLIHPNVARIYALERHEGRDFIVCQYVKGARPWIPSSEPFSSQWPLLEQIFGALEFAHDLSVAHGHLHPGNLLVDDHNVLFIADFGLPPNLDSAHEYRDYLSPQVREGRSPDTSDDIYSLGCHLFRALTGRAWRSGETFQTDSPIPDDIRRMVSDMLRESPYERPARVSNVKRALEHWLSGDESAAPIEIQQPGFFRRQSSERGLDTVMPAHRLPRERRVMSASAAFIGFAILILLAGGVLFLLPERQPARNAIDQRPAPQPPPSAQAGPRPAAGPPEMAPVEIARLERLKEEGKELGNELVRLQVRLEDSGVQIWAAEKYKEITAQSTRGDSLFRDGKYEEAIDVYESVIAALEQLRDNIDAIEARNLEAGKQALEDGEPRRAIEAYTVLTTIDPDNRTYAAGLERAENLEEVLAHMQQGRMYENDGEPAKALDEFRLARDLDSGWQPAGRAVDRVQRKIARQNFTNAMSRGFTALADGRYERARAAFLEARTVFPDSQEPDDGLQQVELARQLDTIEAHKEGAAEFEDEEQWPKAIDEYEAALAMDGTLAFAQQGLERAKSRLEINLTLDEFLDDPAVMQADKQLAAARKAVAEAGRIENAGPKLKEKVSELSRYIALARVPIPLEVESDNQTEVIVYKVGKLGKIESKRLELYPGKYTIVGQREGYRDVQEQVTLLAGQGPQSVYVSCTEKI